MKQNNTDLKHLSKALLEKFDSIATPENVKPTLHLGLSNVYLCKCGCKHVEHLLEPICGPHYRRHYVELCDKHKL